MIDKKQRAYKMASRDPISPGPSLGKTIACVMGAESLRTLIHMALNPLMKCAVDVRVVRFKRFVEVEVGVAVFYSSRTKSPALCLNYGAVSSIVHDLVLP